MGFPYLTDYREVTDLDFAIKHNGLYLCRLDNLPANIGWMFKKNKDYILISAMLKYLKNRNVKIEVFGGLYGLHSDAPRISNKDFKFEGRKPYFTAVSKWNMNPEFFE